MSTKNGLHNLSYMLLSEWLKIVFVKYLRRICWFPFRQKRADPLTVLFCCFLN